MALFLIGSIFCARRGVYQEKRSTPVGGTARRHRSFAGFRVRVGWSPCLGPILGFVLGIAGAAARGAGRRRRLHRVYSVVSLAVLARDSSLDSAAERSLGERRPIR